ncbi:MAG: hypothetical protein IJ093_02010 [Bacilli bacterium]|nr:hypothetical protein [Bacilli bacterium]
MNMFNQVSLENINDLRLLKQYRKDLISGNQDINNFINLLTLENINQKETINIHITLPQSKNRLIKMLDFMAPSQIAKNNNFKRIQSADENWQPVYKIAHQIGRNEEITISKPIEKEGKIIHLHRTVESTPKAA